MERPKLMLLNKLPYYLSFLLLVNLSPKDNAVTTINIPVVYSIVLSVTSLKSDVIITPVNTYFATSIRKSANFSCRWFTCGFGDASAHYIVIEGRPAVFGHKDRLDEETDLVNAFRREAVEQEQSAWHSNNR